MAYVSTVEIKDDFDPGKIMLSGQCFRISKRDDGGYRFIHRGHVLDLREKKKNIYEISCPQKEFDTLWTAYFDLGRNYGAIRRKIPSDDHYLKAAAEFGRGIRILRQEPWETLVSFIISQRKNIPAITAAVNALCSGYGKKIGDTGENEFPAAYELADLTDEEWKALKLGYREAYVRAAVNAAPDMEAKDKLTDAELLADLMSMHGVGIKVANCTALFSYGRTDLAPVDVWIKKVFDEHYGGENILEGRKDAGILQQYLFYYARFVQ
ncbi:MAG: DNA-3-methyladenine glycosylase 2 family protein [Lachnospiraceae bacterium]|nr:DNA-3-methyladenine glycosylase 2 family protein [Lachnospiraceae bacterium]